MEPGILDLCDAALRQMEAMGAVVEPLSPPFPARKAVVRLDHAAGDAERRQQARLAEGRPKRALTKPETIWEIEQGLGLSAQAVYEASVIRSRWHAHAARLFDRYDAVALPSAQVWPFPTTGAGRRRLRGTGWTPITAGWRWYPASLIGLPALSVPVGFSDTGLPMGLQIIGRSGDDAGVLGIGPGLAPGDRMATTPPAAALGQIVQRDTGVSASMSRRRRRPTTGPSAWGPHHTTGGPSGSHRGYHLARLQRLGRSKASDGTPRSTFRLTSAIVDGPLRPRRCGPRRRVRRTRPVPARSCLGTAAVAVLGHVLLDDRGPQRHGGNGGGVVKRMVRQYGDQANRSIMSGRVRRL